MNVIFYLIPLAEYMKKNRNIDKIVKATIDWGDMITVSKKNKAILIRAHIIFSGMNGYYKKLVMHVGQKKFKILHARACVKNMV